MNSKKQLWILVGGNGAGKSTFYRLALQPLGIPFINADIIAKELFPESPEEHSYDAARAAEELRYNLLKEGQNFCFETVFSHPSKVDFIAHAVAYGYEVVMVLVHLEHDQVNQGRVAQRVSEGGHNVPADKIVDRIPRTLENIKKALPLVTELRILDNSQPENPFVQLATFKHGNMINQIDKPKAWQQNLIQSLMAKH